MKVSQPITVNWSELLQQVIEDLWDNDDYDWDKHYAEEAEWDSLPKEMK